MSPLVEKQTLFAILHARWVVWCYEQGYRITKAEGYVGDTDAADRDYDGPHKQGGNHYNRLAEDDNLLARRGPRQDYVMLTHGDEPEWTVAGEKWESMDPLCRWGGRWGDANHLGLAHEGRA